VTPDTYSAPHRYGYIKSGDEDFAKAISYLEITQWAFSLIAVIQLAVGKVSDSLR